MWSAKFIIQNVFELVLSESLCVCVVYVPVHKNISLKVGSAHSSECDYQFQKARPFLHLLRIIYQMSFFLFLFNLYASNRDHPPDILPKWSNPCPKLKSYETEFLIRLNLSINLDRNRWFFWHYLIFNVDHFSVKRFDPNV